MNNYFKLKKKTRPTLTVQLHNYLRIRFRLKIVKAVTYYKEPHVVDQYHPDQIIEEVNSILA